LDTGTVTGKGFEEAGGWCVEMDDGTGEAESAK